MNENEEILCELEPSDGTKVEEILPSEPLDTPPELTDEPEKTEEQDTSEEDTEPEESLETLRAELSRLRAELENRRASFERISGELEEFGSLFPAVPLSSVPDSVWQSVKGGVPIAAAYALYEKKMAALEAEAALTNRKNSSASTGPVGSEPTAEYFSPDDVRAMSREEVRKYYPKIIESMKSWS